MRIFVAVKLSESLREQITRRQQKYNLPVRWTAAKYLHITLVPPWYEEDAEKVKSNLRRLQKHAAFSVHFHTVEYGPPKRPRLIWATGETTKELLLLQEHIESALGAHHERQFKLHATIARFKEFKNLPQIREKVDWKENIKSIVLMESKLSTQGAEIEVLEEIKLE